MVTTLRMRVLKILHQRYRGETWRIKLRARKGSRSRKEVATSPPAQVPELMRYISAARRDGRLSARRKSTVPSFFSSASVFVHFFPLSTSTQQHTALHISHSFSCRALFFFYFGLFSFSPYFSGSRRLVGSGFCISFYIAVIIFFFFQL